MFSNKKGLNIEALVLERFLRFIEMWTSGLIITVFFNPGFWPLSMFFLLVGMVLGFFVAIYSVS